MNNDLVSVSWIGLIARPVIRAPLVHDVHVFLYVSMMLSLTFKVGLEDTFDGGGIYNRLFDR